MAEVIEGELIVERVASKVIVRQAPATARVTLALIQRSDPDLLRVDGNSITIGEGGVVYRVTDWDAVQSALIAERVK